MKYIGDSETMNWESTNTCRPANMLCMICNYAFGATVDTKQVIHSDSRICVIQAVTNIYILTLEGTYGQ